MSALISTWSRLFPGQPDQVQAARYFARATLAGRTNTDVAELIVSELATNTLAHTASGQPDGWFIVQVAIFTEHVQIRVFDLGGKTTPAVIAEPDGHEHGRGLLTVAGIATRWGVEGDEFGRVVWANIASQAKGTTVSRWSDDTAAAALRHLGVRVREMRLASGMTQEELAAASRMGRRTVSRIEHGSVDVRFDGLLLLAQSLRCDAADLVSDFRPTDAENQNAAAAP